MKPWRLLESIAAAEPARRGVLRQIGIANYRKGDFLNAAANFKKALDEDPGDNEAVQLIGACVLPLAGRPAEAIAPLEKVQTWFPSAKRGLPRIFWALLHADEGLSQRSQGVCQDVRCAG